MRRPQVQSGPRGAEEFGPGPEGLLTGLTVIDGGDNEDNGGE
ncbi:hypothetical protein [Streptomyces sp. NPDC088757]